MKTRKRATILIGLVRVHGEVQGRRASAWEAVYATARRIPRGRVMTYGQIATLLGSRLSPRAVGWAMHGCPRNVPWHRVVNASGGCSTDRLPHIRPGTQQSLLRAEGVRFRPDDTLDLAVYRWIPRPSRSHRQAPSSPERSARKPLACRQLPRQIDQRRRG